MATEERPVAPSRNAPPADLQRQFDLYSEYGKTLRLWLVAYGVGAPVLFLTESTVAKKIVESGYGTFIAVMFLLGALFQVLNASVNKWAAWYVYRAARDEKPDDKFPFNLALWISDQFWIDLGLDLATIAVFGWATLCTLRIMVG